MGFLGLYRGHEHHYPFKSSRCLARSVAALGAPAVYACLPVLGRLRQQPVTTDLKLSVAK